MVRGGVRLDRVPAEHRVCTPLGLVCWHAPGAVDEGQLVRIDVEVGKGRSGPRARGGRGQQLTLRAHRDVLTGAHGQGSREESGEAREQDRRRRRAARGHAEHQSEVAHEAVVRTEDSGPEGARHPRPPAGGEPAYDLLVHAFVGRHGWCGVDVVVVGRAALRPLGKGEDEDRPEPSGQQREQSQAQARPTRAASGRTQKPLPVGDVAFLGIGDAQQDLSVLAALVGREPSIERGLRAFVSEPLTPPPDVGGARGGSSPRSRPLSTRHGTTLGERGATGTTEARSGVRPDTTEITQDEQSCGWNMLIRW